MLSPAGMSSQSTIYFPSDCQTYCGKSILINLKRLKQILFWVFAAAFNPWFRADPTTQVHKAGETLKCIPSAFRVNFNIFFYCSSLKADKYFQLNCDFCWKLAGGRFSISVLKGLPRDATWMSSEYKENKALNSLVQCQIMI